MMEYEVLEADTEGMTDRPKKKTARGILRFWGKEIEMDRVRVAAKEFADG